MTTAFDALRKPITDPITGGTFAPDELDVVLEDLDVEKFVLDLANFKRGKMNVRKSILDVSCELSLDGAHQVTLTIHDADRELYHSGILNHAIDVEIRGWWWRLVRRSKSADDITLTFEPRIITWMRAEKGRKKIRRGRVTRAEFIRGLVKAIKKGHPKFIAPELHKKQHKAKPEDAVPQTRSEGTRRKNRDPGLPKGYRIPGEKPGERLNATQTSNAERVLVVADQMGARRKVMLMTMMTVYQESRFSTAATNGSHVGLFQQDPKYWPATRDPETDAKAFLKALMAADKLNPNGGFNEVIQSVQKAGPGEDIWANWRSQAEDIISNYTGDNSTNTSTLTLTKPYEFRVRKKENYYGAAMRLADEVNWRLWTVKNTFHYQSEESLFKSKSLLTLKEGEGGIDQIDFDDDSRKPVTEVTVTCRMRMWPAPIGTVVTVADDGPADGRYLIHTIRRSYLSPFGEITLRKPTEAKDEPANETKTQSISWQAGGELTGDVISGAKPGEPTSETITVGPSHETLGLPGFPAHDFIAPAGSPCVAPVDGSITKQSGTDPAKGPPQGPHGPFGWSLYIWGDDGKTYYLTHMGSVLAHVGQTVRQGQKIGTVGNYARWGGANHIHMGVHTGRA